MNYCRTCRSIMRFRNKKSICIQKDTEFFCLMCHSKNNFLSHPSGDYWEGNIAECNNCHNYDMDFRDGKLMIESFHYSNLHIVNNYFDNMTHVFQKTEHGDLILNSRKILPLLSINDKEKFIEKLKMVVLFL